MFRGITTPIMITIDQRPGLDYATMKKIIEFLLAMRVDGMLFLGSSGEFFAFPQAEKDNLFSLPVTKWPSVAKY